jgi:hypothetical protein
LDGCRRRVVFRGQRFEKRLGEAEVGKSGH